MAYGDGGAQKGEVHEAMNFAAIHHLPCIFICQNNLYTQSVPLALKSSIPSIAVRAAAYGFPGVSVDGMDMLAVYKATAAAPNAPAAVRAHTHRSASLPLSSKYL